MSQKPYDFLVSDKEPFVYVEKSIVRMDDGFLTLLQGERGKTILAPSGHLLMLLGAGTSITQEAAIFCAFHDLHVAFARGGCNIHSLFMAGRYQDPERLVEQVSLAASHKLEVARLLMMRRLIKRGATQESIQDMLACPSVQALIAWEGRMAKVQYREFALKSKVSFTRDFDANDPVNAKLNVLNNALYSISAAICLACSLSPSVGFIHGLTRRGGLAFDLADLIKQETTLPIAFDSKIKSSRHAMYELSKALKANNGRLFKEMLRVALLIGEGNLKELEAYCAGGRSQ